MAATVDSTGRTTHAGPVPWVAMYHSVGDCSDDPYRITVTPERLDGQLRWLRARGLRGVSTADLLAARARGEGRGLVGLTFDDGYADFVERALPVLRRHDCGATLFVLPGRLGGDNLSVYKRQGSHGLTHVDLTKADDDTLHREVTESRALLAELTGEEVAGFCYPYGTVDRRAVDAVRAAGYTYACAIDPGPLNGVHALPRVHVGQHDTAVRLFLKYRLHRLRRRPVEGV
ncbi:polysaccharide deacetylase family protein [Streptomyces resistomycificus]|uniref:polysaccharide deacetylase family protein n=1 Tax=Streptomyces resistomycificus TaxID=67356 RepID=UPI0004AA4571|nr:polysaccharide deacetylase family protein [Streptomyces resistomycificus]